MIWREGLWESEEGSIAVSLVGGEEMNDGVGARNIT